MKTFDEQFNNKIIDSVIRKKEAKSFIEEMLKKIAGDDYGCVEGYLEPDRCGNCYGCNRHFYRQEIINKAKEYGFN